VQRKGREGGGGIVKGQDVESLQVDGDFEGILMHQKGSMTEDSSVST